MASNDLAPGFIRLYYTSNGHPHVQVLPISFDSTPVAGTEPNLESRDGSAVAASAFMAAYLAVWRAIFPIATAWTGFEVYSKEILGDPQYIWGDDLTIVGSNGSGVQSNSQVTYTFRTNQGGVMRLVAMEAAIATTVRAPLRTTLAAPNGAIATYILGATNCIIGRDGGFPISGIFITSKVNDALRKRYTLNA